MDDLVLVFPGVFPAAERNQGSNLTGVISLFISVLFYSPLVTCLFDSVNIPLFILFCIFFIFALNLSFVLDVGVVCVRWPRPMPGGRQKLAAAQ